MTVTAVELRPDVRASRRWIYAVLGLGVVYLLGTRAAWFFTIDDAYITFRYSANLAAGHGPVWNVGEDPVEGFTNFLWMVWHTPFSWLGANLATVAKVSAFAAGIGILITLVRHAWERGGMAPALVAGGAFTLFVPTYFHITSGLETVAFALVVLRGVVLGLRAVEGLPVRVWEPPVILLVAGMLRPDGVLAALPAFLFWLWLNRGRRAWGWTAAAALVGAAYFGWRWSFYGHLLPNTFYIKFGNLATGVQWLEKTVWLVAPLLVLTASLVLRRTTRAAGSLLCATVLAAYLTYAVSGPTMDYLHRFAYHAVPVLCLGAGLAVVGLKRWLASGVGVVAVGWLAVAGAQAPDLGLIANYGPDLARAHVPIGKGLANADVPAEHRTVTLHDAGAIPYYSGWTTVDFIGLNDEPIAHGATVTTRVTGARSTVVVVRSYTPAPVRSAYGLDVARATEGYVYLGKVQMRSNYFKHIYALPEWADEVRAAVFPVVAEAQRTYDPGRYELTVDRWLERVWRDFPW